MSSFPRLREDARQDEEAGSSSRNSDSKNDEDTIALQPLENFIKKIKTFILQIKLIWTPLFRTGIFKLVAQKGKKLASICNLAAFGLKIAKQIHSCFVRSRQKFYAACIESQLRLFHIFPYKKVLLSIGNNNMSSLSCFLQKFPDLVTEV